MPCEVSVFGRQESSRGTGRERRMILGMRRSGKRRTLTGQISRIVLVLILVGLMEAGAAYTMLEWYHEQVSELEYTISDIYLSETDQNFNLINTSIRSMLHDGNEVLDVVESYYSPVDYAAEVERLAYILGKNNSVIQLKNAFADMVIYYGSRFNFFFLNPEKQLSVEYGGGEYAKRADFMKMLEQYVEMDEVRYTINGKWFLLGDYICTIYHSSNGIGGAYIWAEDFATNMFGISPTGCSSIDIYDPGNQSSLVYAKQENGLVSTAELVTNVGMPEDSYRLEHAGFVCRFVMDTSKYEKTVLLPVLFLGLLAIYLVIIAVTWLYTRRRVLGQVNSFYNNLIEYKDTERFAGDMGVEEFAEAGKVLNQRSEEISQLKISVYEEQINRQKVELDYAQLQIRPHFYINCLNIIHSMAQERLTGEIQAFVVYISRYFRYIFKKGMVPVTVLDQIFRQAEDSRIAHNAKSIKEGVPELYYGPDFAFVAAEDQAQAADLIRRIYQRALRTADIEQVQILTPFRATGDASANSLNAAIQEAINPPATNKPEISNGGRLFRLGDRVMQVKNDYDKAVKVPGGTCKGWTLEQVARDRPPSLKWLRYTAPFADNVLKAAADIVLNDLELKMAG